MKWPFSTPRNIERTGDVAPLSNIYQFIWRMSGRHQILIGLLSVLIAAVSIAPLELQRRIINEGVEARNLDLLLMLAAVFLGVILVRRLLKFLLGIYQGWLSESAVRFCREVLAELALKRGQASGERDADASSESAKSDDMENDNPANDPPGEGQSVSVIRSEIDQVGQFVGTGISDPVAEIFKIIFALGYMIYVEPVVALIALGFFMPQFVTVPFLQRVLNKLIRERTDLLRDLSDAIVELDEKHREPDEDFDARLDRIFSNRMKSVLFKHLIKAIINILNSLAPLSVMVFGGYLYMQDATSLGVIVAFMSGFDRLAGPTRAMVAYYRIASIKNEQHRKIAEWMC